MKNETLEEAAERISELQEGTYTSQHKLTYKHGFLDGAKWQQEKIYNEIKELHDSEDITGFSQWTLAKCLDIIKNK